jgi:hypothetical protein
MTEPNWPSEEHEITDQEHLQAIGQFALAYNFIEEILAELFRIYFPTREDYAQIIYHTLNNRQRVDMLGEIVAHNEGHTKFREYIQTALNYFNICTDNRNLVLHATADMATGLSRIRLSKRSRNNPREINLYEVSLTELRQVADDASNTFEFIFELLGWIDQRGKSPVTDPLPPLPEIPPEPHRLIPFQHPKANTVGPPPLGS